MRLLRTPDERFRDLPSYDFAPRYLNFRGARVHWIEHGEGPPVLCLHGEPAWSYTWRHVGRAIGGRYRFLAMDFLGFGRSDKPVGVASYSFDLHRASLVRFVESLDLSGLTLVVQDWGGMVALSTLEALEHRVSRLVILNTVLPDGTEPPDISFLHWRAFVARMPDVEVGRRIRNAFAEPARADPAVLAAFDAPFPNAMYKDGVRAWPLMMPVRRDDSIVSAMVRARSILARWRKPALVLFPDRDPATRGFDAFLRGLIPGAGDQAPVAVRNAGRFPQEEQPLVVARHVLDFLDRTREAGARFHSFAHRLPDAGLGSGSWA